MLHSFVAIQTQLTIGPLYVEYLDMVGSCYVLKEKFFSTSNHL